METGGHYITQGPMQFVQRPPPGVVEANEGFVRGNDIPAAG